MALVFILAVQKQIQVPSWSEPNSGASQGTALERTDEPSATDCHRVDNGLKLKHVGGHDIFAHVGTLFLPGKRAHKTSEIVQAKQSDVLSPGTVSTPVNFAKIPVLTSEGVSLDDYRRIHVDKVVQPVDGISSTPLESLLL